MKIFVYDPVELKNIVLG